jgi:Tfp pilus assembly protein PilN
MRITINLLSPERKAFVRRQRWFSFVVRQCVWLLVFTGIIYGVFFGMHWALNEQVQNLRTAEGVRREAETAKRLAGYQSEIQKANQTLNQVTTLETQHIYWSSLLQKIGVLLPEGVVLNSLNNKDYHIFLAGVAKNRDLLTVFRDSLVAESCFTDVQLPLSNLFVQENIDFQMDFILKKSCLKGKTL